MLAGIAARRDAAMVLEDQIRPGDALS